MRAQSTAQRREASRQAKLVGNDISVNKQNELHDMIARRAYELFENRGRVHGHDINDWLDAELEILHPFRHELKETAGAIIFLAELPGIFRAEQIYVAVEPRRLTISGEREIEVTCGGKKPAHTEKRMQRIFLLKELLVEVDPSRAVTRLAGELLEIVMPKLTGTSKFSEKAKAASSNQ